MAIGFSIAILTVMRTPDADSPDEIPELYRMITEDGYDLVSGWKQKRFDPLSKTIPTNKTTLAMARKVSGIAFRTISMRPKAIARCYKKHRSVRRNASLYFYPASAGFRILARSRVAIPARKFGKGGWNRFFNGYLDLISLWFLSTFGIKHMVFGILGSLMFFVGFVAVIIVVISKLYYMRSGMPYCLDRFSIFIRHDIRDYRHAVICGRFSRRADIPQCTRTQ